MESDQQFPLAAEGFHDACGVGFIAETSGIPSRRVVDLSFTALERMAHRGAYLSDQNTGDGAGILTDIPLPFFHAIIENEFNTRLKKSECLGIGMVFTSSKYKPGLQAIINRLAEKNKLGFIGVRKVPFNKKILGDIARRSCPQILQFLFSGKDFKNLKLEDRLYLFRRQIEKCLDEEKNRSFLCSLSCKTIVYKGLLSAAQLRPFYTDLNHADYNAKVAVFHERYSTNTISTWSMAQPFRLIAHNGEINTIKGNRLWMNTREKTIKSKKWKSRLKDILPVIWSSGSDSFSLDNVFEFLSRSGRSLYHSIMMMIPDPYYRNRRMPKSLKNFFIYHENFMEPWDGPAALIFSDGDHVGAKMDRNGLRPLRYSISDDGLIVMASEAGVVDIPDKNLILHHHMSSGEIFGLTLDGSGQIENKNLKLKVAGAAPYADLLKKLVTIKRGLNEDEFADFELPESGFNKINRLLFGFDMEDLTRILIPMAKSGREPLGSMGDDTPPAFMSRHPKRLYDYFKQAFAQVTNPPIDPIRERSVMSLVKYLGSEDNLLAEKPSFHGAVRIDSPILSPRDIQVFKENQDWFSHKVISCTFHKSEFLKHTLEAIVKKAEHAVKTGNRLIFLSDENLQEDHLPVPPLLAVSAIHQHLIKEKIRSSTSIICITGELVEDHHAACLIGFGASAVYPYMAYELIREHFRNDNWIDALANYRRGLEKGLLKIMGKMGISTLSSYHGSMNFHGIGLGYSFRKEFFPDIKCSTGGTDLRDIKVSILSRLNQIKQAERVSLPTIGKFKYKKSGEFRGYSPADFKDIQTKSQNRHTAIAKGQNPIYIRDLLTIKKGRGSTIDNPVESIEKITSRFGISAMSFGALSEEAHRALAEGAYLAGARSNTGEGGEHVDRYNLTAPKKQENSTVKQIASGRFGVTTEFLVAAKEIQIKMAQGAKPGEGGQLPGHKVSFQIASVRMTTPGIPLISPPPHHDIYSIEDIAQLIYDLKMVNRRVKVSVKLVAQPGIGLVASGVVKAGADIILVSGADGGTGASPLGSLRHTGLPWELGLAEVHQTLMKNELRSKVILRVDGGLKTGRDIIIAALLGAEEFDFGTASLISLGCIMARQCHNNTCPTGVATQDETLRKKFSGKPENLAGYLNTIATEVQDQLLRMGYSSLNQITGRADLLKMKKNLPDIRPVHSLNPYCIIPEKDGEKLGLYFQVKSKSSDNYSSPHIDDDIFEEVRMAVMTQGHAVVHRKITNQNRSVGTRLSGDITFLYGQSGFKGNVQIRLSGAAGQSLGAFLIQNLEIRMKGVANDYVGKGMSGGLITVRPSRMIREKKGLHTLVGNVALYGATGGRLLVAGKVSERFAVRNSGAAAVIEGAGAHCCEYMTRGTVVCLGPIGRNFGAGMTGGLAFLYSPVKQNLESLNRDYVRPTDPSETDLNLIWKMMRSHKFHTASPVARDLLNSWHDEKQYFVKIIPKALDIVDFGKLYDQQVNYKMGVMLNE